MYAKVIVNPFAGGGATRRKWPHISELLRDSGLSFDHEFTEGPGHGIELAREAAAQGYELVIAIGGDGTVNEVVNGLVDDTGKGRATLGIIGMGTGGDAIRTLGIPHDYEKACRLFSNFRKVTIDLGAVEYMSGSQRERRIFLNTAGLGFDAAVVERHRELHLKRKGTIPYVRSLVLALVGHSNKRVTLKVDRAVEEQQVFTIVVNNGRYFGGGMKVAPDADLSDGLLDVIIIGDMSRPEFLWNFPRVYRGTHITHPKVSTYQAKSIEVESEDGLLLQADGELLGQAPARLWVVPAALSVAI